MPTFRTIPQRTIVLSPEDSIGVLACSIQRYNNNTELVITQQPGGDIIVNGFSPFLPSIFGYSHIPETNLLINLTDFEKPSDFVSETYACSLIGTGMEHRTTFVHEGMYVNGSTSIVVLEACEWNCIDRIRVLGIYFDNLTFSMQCSKHACHICMQILIQNVCAEPIMFTVTEKAVRDALVEGEGGTINFSIMAGYNIARVLKDGKELALIGSNTPEAQYSVSMESGNTTYTLTIPSATKEHEGIYQFEAESDKAGRIVEYHHVTVKCKFEFYISFPPLSISCLYMCQVSIIGGICLCTQYSINYIGVHNLMIKYVHICTAPNIWEDCMAIVL